MTSPAVATEYLQAEADLKKTKDRQIKAERTNDVGDPTDLKGKVIRLNVREDDAWTAESGAVVRRVDLKTGKTKQLYKGHGGPVTCIEFYSGSLHSSPLLITGAWDTTIRVWKTDSKELVSTTLAHDDFLKSLVVLPTVKLLASGSSDKTIKLWQVDLSVLDDPDRDSGPLPLVGSLSGHRRPVDCLAVDVKAPVSVARPLLYSGDSMGVIRVWNLDISERSDRTRSVRGITEAELTGHRTGVCTMTVADGQIWSGSSDNTILLQTFATSDSIGNNPQSAHARAAAPNIVHRAPVRALLPLSVTSLERSILLSGSGDLLTAWDVSAFGERDGETEVISEVDAHWHDITGIGLWIRTTDGQKEAWIVTASLDGTLRKWKLSDIINRKYELDIRNTYARQGTQMSVAPSGVTLSAEEEAELAALMSDDE